MLLSAYDELGSGMPVAAAAAAATDRATGNSILRTALDYAIKNAAPDAVRCLLDGGADPGRGLRGRG